ncbi:MAG: hypothetical protein KVP17_001580 [Porospora cf. gigantea B]|uniref:uncharacterized protein n=1 Tax=Porospora cf. gigantea B TaxID=2853592 RepID=UPI003571A8E5|nr:MAG: hypothetical protein KVP17_001580 [Porospora cf. gigantea B]
MTREEGSRFRFFGHICCQANHTVQHETTVIHKVEDPSRCTAQYLDELLPKGHSTGAPDKVDPPLQRVLTDTIVPNPPIRAVPEKVEEPLGTGARGRARPQKEKAAKPRSEPTMVPSSSTPPVKFDVPRRAYFKNSASYCASSASWTLEEDRKALVRKIERDTELVKLQNRLNSGLEHEKQRCNGKVRKDILRPKGTSDVAVCVANRFTVGKKVGSGSFGVIYLGRNLYTGLEVAIKMEHVRRPNPHLILECKIYGLLQGVAGVPKLFWYGVEGEYCIMVIELLGPSLEDLFSYCGRKFRLKTTLMLAHQMIDRIGDVQATGIIHRDIKPHNFLIGSSNRENRVFVIDFGLAKRFQDGSGRHIPYIEGKSLTGTARYVSINTHIGIEQARRDDFESLGYVFVYFARGSLPWQGLRAQSKKEKYEKIMKKKIGVSVKDLCRGLPAGFEKYLDYCRKLSFTQMPDVDYMKGLVTGMMADHDYEFDTKWDWKAGLEDEERQK